MSYGLSGGIEPIRRAKLSLRPPPPSTGKSL
jgi:hypothetical protein